MLMMIHVIAAKVFGYIFGLYFCSDAGYFPMFIIYSFLMVWQT